MPLAMRSSAIWPLTDCDRMVDAAVTAASAAAARTSASARASARAILPAAGFVSPGDKIFHLGLGFGRDAFGFGLRRCNDVLGLALRCGVTRLVFRQQLGG